MNIQPASLQGVSSSSSAISASPIQSRFLSSKAEFSESGGNRIRSVYGQTEAQSLKNRDRDTVGSLG